jgi:hypothetical protein
MTFERSAVAAALAIACGVGGCGDLHDLSVASSPLLVLHGHVDVATLARMNPDAPLVGALVWSEVPAVSPLCLEFNSPKIQPACPDPYGVFDGTTQVAAPVDANGDFDLALYDLPMVGVSVGDASTRISYGSLVVVEDVNGDGQPSLPTAPSDERDAPSSSGGIHDSLVAASFHSLHANQARVVFREGGFVAGSYFYPAPGCDPPPPGFSIMSAPPYTGGPADPGTCSFGSTDGRVEVPALSAGDAQALLCRPVQIGTNVRQPDSDGPRGPAGNAVCLSSGILAEVYPGTCPWLRGYALKGCAQDPLCASPEWDITASPPAWWPCP